MYRILNLIYTLFIKKMKTVTTLLSLLLIISVDVIALQVKADSSSIILSG